MSHQISSHAGRTLALASMAEEDRVPMPAEGMQAISAICAQASAATMELMRSSPAGLGNIVTGNNASTPPPAQRISEMNGALLASLAAAVPAIARAVSEGSSGGLGDLGTEGGEAAGAEAPEAAAEAADEASSDAGEASASSGDSED